MQPKEKTIREGLKHMREVAGGGGGEGLPPTGIHQIYR